jgi:nucleoside-diphosphate-sugar epimerase
MNVVLTGATGFVGRSVLVACLSRGIHVHALVRKGSIVRIPSSPGSGLTVHAYTGDYASVAAAFEEARATAVVHLASLFLSSHKPDDIPELVDSNLKLAAFVAEAASSHGCRGIVNAGTAWQHYQDQDYCPVNLYAATKQACEDILRYYAEARSLRVVTIKLFDTYGPGDTRRKIIPLLLQALRQGSILDLSPGEQLLDLVYADDVASGFMGALDLVAGAEGGFVTHTLGSGRPVSLRVLVQTIEAVSGKRLNVRFGARPYRDREVMVPWSRGVRLPGWEPLVGLEEGIRRTLKATESEDRIRDA